MHMVVYVYIYGLQEESLLVSEACHFMKYSLGSYGWPLYVYMNPCNGLCNLCPQLKYVEIRPFFVLAPIRTR